MLAFGCAAWAMSALPALADPRGQALLQEGLSPSGVEQLWLTRQGQTAGSGQEEEAAKRPEAQLVVRTLPEGAAVKIDGISVGTSEVEYHVEPGEHVVEASRKGFATATRTVQVVNGETQVLTIFLVEAPSAPAGVTVGKWVAAAGGIGLLATGLVLLAMGGGERSEAGMRLPEKNNNTALGAGLLGGGVALSALAAYLFYRDAEVYPRPTGEGQEGGK